MNKVIKHGNNSEIEFKLIDETVLMDYQKAVNAFQDITPEKIGPEEIILLLLGIIPDKPIKGKTMLIKQIFLTEKDIFDNDVQELKYIAHKFGPHSFMIDNMLRNMEFIGMIKKTKNNYSITEKGLIGFNKIKQHLDLNKLNKLKHYRIAWDELGMDRVLNLVYTKYPKYTNKSIIKHRYQVIKWEKKNED